MAAVRAKRHAIADAVLRHALAAAALPPTAAEDLLEIVMRRYERAATLLTSNRPIEDWGKLLGDNAAVTALLDRLLHHAHVLKAGPRSWRMKPRRCASGCRRREGMTFPPADGLCYGEPTSNDKPHVPDAPRLAGFDPSITGRI